MKTLLRLPIAALFWAAISCSSEKPEEAETARESESGNSSFTNQVELATSLGEIVIELYPEQAPESVANFLTYVEQGYYDSTLFHRVIDGYLIEAGKVKLEDGKWVEQATADPIPNEARNGLRNERGTLAMARTARPDSATAAFFINLGDNLALNYPQPDGHGYAVFGRVISGMEVADQIGHVETDVVALSLLHPATGQAVTRDVANVPIDAVTILSAGRIAK